MGKESIAIELYKYLGDGSLSSFGLPYSPVEMTIKAFMDSTKDKIWIERFWKTIKYKYTYILPEENGAPLYSGIRDSLITTTTNEGIKESTVSQVPSKLSIRPAA